FLHHLRPFAILEKFGPLDLFFHQAGHAGLNRQFDIELARMAGADHEIDAFWTDLGADDGIARHTKADAIGNGQLAAAGIVNILREGVLGIQAVEVTVRTKAGWRRRVAAILEAFLVQIAPAVQWIDNRKTLVRHARRQGRRPETRVAG